LLALAAFVNNPAPDLLSPPVRRTQAECLHFRVRGRSRAGSRLSPAIPTGV